MRALRLGLWPAAGAFGVAAELAGHPPLPAMDAITGFTLLAMGLLAWRRQPRYAIAWILAAASISWFAGTVASWAVFLHRGRHFQRVFGDIHAYSVNVLSGTQRQSEKQGAPAPDIQNRASLRYKRKQHFDRAQVRPILLHAIAKAGAAMIERLG